MKKITLTTLLSACLLVIQASAFAEENTLATVLATQSDDVKARYQYRHPQQTLDFFGIKPGMTVVEALPGGGWYSKILLPVLGADGTLVGVDYQQALWPNFEWMKPDAIEAKKSWVATWTADAEAWRDADSAKITAFQFAELPDTMKGSADAVLFIRALHNLARFETKGGFLTSALEDTLAVLKPGGIVGIVQHQAREDRPDSWADGSNGYLKKSHVKEAMTNAGFEFIGESAINENPNDQATEGDIVWRLPPSLSGARDDAEKRASMEAIGESNRMTLLFKKPE
ncbi:class I SAM-dependent methyltransferase [Arenicella xantha]|uniref:Putative methyltransferase n=1 Tax=Arenicella xantha TaxID=644221 RepID=A0A395JNL7_9GAMM|nr:class I SAM-dependent methyltransferase [Arenicella xantha]RBP49674.1 putative methyltransferase [Arenicella xantha]